ncbi:MAG: hypothetical protein HND52_14145 [Ignavibacteriae bacterium]|nr:hypothetical protein [Ignavibacteriota bacterium]
MIRLMFPPRHKFFSNRLIIAFIFIMIFFGLPRIYSTSAVVTEILYSLIFLLGILVSYKLFSDYSIYYLSNVIFYFSIILIILHASAWIWYPYSYGDLSNYIGSFPDKFLSSTTFLAIIPFLYIRLIKKRSFPSLIVLLMSVLFMFWTFRRTVLVAFLFGLLFFLFYRKRIRLLMGSALFILISFIIIPKEYYYEAFQRKIIIEYEDYLHGNVENVGSGRIAVYLLGWNKYKNANLKEQLIGFGAAQSHELAYIIWQKDTYAHGQIIATLYDYGIIGLLFLILFFYSITKTALRYKMYNPKLNGAIIFVIFSSIGITLSNILIATGGTGLLVAILLGYSSTIKLNYENTRNKL